MMKFASVCKIDTINHMAEQYLTIKEASKILGVTTLTLRNWDKSGILVAYRNPVNDYRIYKISQIEKMIEEIENSRKGKHFRIKVIREDDTENK